MTAGVYMIRNAVTGRRYVGKSSQVGERWCLHLSSLKLGKHHSRTMQEDYDAHGAQSFEIGLLEVFTGPHAVIVQREGQRFLQDLWTPWARRHEADWYERLQPEYNMRPVMRERPEIRMWAPGDIAAKGGSDADTSQ